MGFAGAFDAAWLMACSATGTVRRGFRAEASLLSALLDAAADLLFTDFFGIEFLERVNPEAILEQSAKGKGTYDALTTKHSRAEQKEA